MKHTSTRAMSLLAFVPFVAVACGPPDTDETALERDTLAGTPAQETPAAGQPMGAMNEADLGSFILTVNTLEIAEAQLAEQQAENEEVRQFAQQLRQDHEQANQQVRQMTGAAQYREDQGQHAQEFRQEASQSLERMRGLSGAEFDRAFLQHQVQMHQRVLDTLDRSTGATMQGDMQGFLPQLRSTLEQHLQRAQQLQQQLGAGTGAARDTT